MKRVLIGIVVVLVLLVAAALVAPGFVDWDRYKGTIESQASDFTGRAVRIGGSISMTLLPAPAISVAEVSVSNAPGARQPEMVGVQRVEARLHLLPLFVGDIRVSTIVIDTPVIHLEVDKDGRANWLFDANGPASPDEPEVGTPTQGGLPVDISLDRLLVRDGTITYFDPSRQIDERIESLDGELSAGSIMGPFRAEGDARARDRAIDFTLSVGAIEPNRTIPVALEATVDETVLAIAFNGNATGVEEDARLNGVVGLEAANVGDLIAAYSGADGDVAPHLAYPLAIKADFAAARDSLRLREINASYGKVNIVGDAALRFDPIIDFTVALSVPLIDLDAMGMAPTSTIESTPAMPAAVEEVAGPDAFGFVIPPDARGIADIDIAGIKYRDQTAQDIGLTLSLENGVLTVARAGALLPGGTNIALTGELRTPGARPSFRGSLSAHSDNARRLAGWFGFDPDRLPPDRFTRLDLQGSVDADAEELRVRDIEFLFDASRVTGDIAYALQLRPAISGELSLDRINLDAYLTQAEAASATEATGSDNSDDISGALRSGRLAVLNEFDADLRLAIGAIRYRGIGVDDVLLDAQLLSGRLALKRASAGNIAGAAANVSGTLQELATTPVGDVAVTVTSPNLEGLFELVGVDPPLSPRALSPARISSTIRRTQDSLRFNLKASLDKSVIDAQGHVRGFVLPVPKNGIGAYQFETEFVLSNPSFADISSQLGLPLPAPAKDGPVRVNSSASGTVDAMNVNSSLAVGGGVLSVAGRLEKLMAEPAFALKLTGEADDSGRLLAALGRDVGRSPGPFRLAAAIEGTRSKATLESAAVDLGTMRVTGTASYDGTGLRPEVVARIEGNALNLDPLLGGGDVAGGPGAAGGRSAASSGAPWSSDPIDLGFLGEFDADVTAAAQSVSAAGFALGTPDVNVVVADGTAEIRKFKGTLFGGAFNMTGTVKGGAGTAGMTANVTLDGADIEKAAIALLGDPSVTGRLDMSGALSTAGRSEMELVAFLAGDADVRASNGVIRGIDLKRLSDRLDNLNKAGDFVALAAGALSGGETRYESLNIPLIARNGVIKTGDVDARIEAANSDLTAVIDLPSYRIDARGRFSLKDHPDAPDVGVSFVGPLDAPLRTIDTKALQRWVTRRLVGRGVDELIGADDRLQQLLGGQGADPAEAGPAPEPQAPPAEAAPPPKRDPAQELFRGIFETLERSRSGDE